ncbi:MAG: hypothetical protein Q9216_001621 [Gyalolechia sp. 2 TL-2023]
MSLQFTRSTTLQPYILRARTKLHLSRGRWCRRTGKPTFNRSLKLTVTRYKTIQRLCADDSIENTYRRSSYISITGGGSGNSLPMLFLTDQEENVNQRIAMAKLMKTYKMVEPSDWVLNLHYSENFYRSLDLSTSTMELAGGSVLCGGHLLPHEKSRRPTADGDADDSVDFIFGKRSMLVEGLSLAVDPQSLPSAQDADWVSEEVVGRLILTSLQRLRNRMVRYVSGDVGSLHPLSPEVASQFSVEMREHLQMLRLYGRHKRFSFKWLGDYYEFDQMDKVMHSPEWGVLQYQIIVSDDAAMEGPDHLEVRILRRAET